MITHRSSLESFYEQISYVLEHFKSETVPTGNFSNIVIGGLGGSGIGGQIARGFYLDKATCPVEVYSDYFLPAYVSDKSLLILSSYSGNTEETLEMFESGLKKKATMLVICSGGILGEKAKSAGIHVYSVPNGYQPRMALGFSLSYNLMILGQLFGYNAKHDLTSAATIYKNNAEILKQALDISESWKSTSKKPVIVFADETYRATGLRFCQQIQENAKGVASLYVLPEANHNVTESIYGKIDANIIFLNSAINERNNLRFAFLKQLLEKEGNKVDELTTKGNSIDSLLTAICILDWVSIIFSEIKSVDNMSVPNIEDLKNYLSKNQAI
jgi:glucose/mannose-6-phosphate isomerase